MARLLGFGGPIIFIVIFLLINKKHLTGTSGTIYSLAIYVLSIVTGIAMTTIMGGGAIYAGVFAPIFYVVLFTIVVRNSK